MIDQPHQHNPANQLLAFLAPRDLVLLEPHLTHVELERRRILFDVGERVEHVYFPQAGIISFVSVM